MGTIEIPKEHWLEFFDLFSRQHEGWIATLEVAGLDVGDQFEAEQYAFSGASYDPKGTGRGSIDLELGVDPDQHVNHTITQPRLVMLMLTDQGEHEGLDVESEDGTKSILRFRTAEYRAPITGKINEEVNRKMHELTERLARKRRRAGS